MGVCGKNTGIARFQGRKNQAHDSKYCLISCAVAKRSPGIPTPNRCLNKNRKRR